MRIDCTELFEDYAEYLKSNGCYREEIIGIKTTNKGNTIFEEKEVRVYLEDNDDNFKKFCKGLGIDLGHHRRVLEMNDEGTFWYVYI